MSLRALCLAALLAVLAAPVFAAEGEAPPQPQAQTFDSAVLPHVWAWLRADGTVMKDATGTPYQIAFQELKDRKFLDGWCGLGKLTASVKSEDPPGPGDQGQITISNVVLEPFVVDRRYGTFKGADWDSGAHVPDSTLLQELKTCLGFMNSLSNDYDLNKKNEGRWSLEGDILKIHDLKFKLWTKDSKEPAVEEPHPEAAPAAPPAGPRVDAKPVITPPKPPAAPAPEAKPAAQKPAPEPESVPVILNSPLPAPK